MLVIHDLYYLRVSEPRDMLHDDEMPHAQMTMLIRTTLKRMHEWILLVKM